MEPEKDKPTFFFSAFMGHIGISLLIFAVITPVSIFFLYSWANGLGTCVRRPSFTLLSMLEQTVPALMHPIQRLVCPH